MWLPLELPGKVDSEHVLGHQTLSHHVVKDRGGVGGRNVRVSQAHDAVEGAVVQKRPRLRLAQAKKLVCVGNASNLQAQPAQRLET